MVGQINTIFHDEIRESYSWEYTGEQRETERVEPDPLEEDEKNRFISFILFQHDFTDF